MTLTPTIVQDASTGQVLMLGYSNDESLALTRETGLVHFWSRSRDAIWMKGETSGNTLRVVSITPDCDGDALLVTAVPAGATCHTGATSCFATEPPPDAVLGRLAATIADRGRRRPEGSYTASLLGGGVDRCGRKVLEEAGELAFAAKDHAAGEAGDDRIAEEAADLVYHVLVLLEERGVPLESVARVLTARTR